MQLTSNRLNGPRHFGGMAFSDNLRLDIIFLRHQGDLLRDIYDQDIFTGLKVIPICGIGDIGQQLNGLPLGIKANFTPVAAGNINYNPRFLAHQVIDLGGFPDLAAEQIVEHPMLNHRRPATEQN